MTSGECWHEFEAAMEGDCPCKLCGQTENWNYAFGYMISRSRAEAEIDRLRDLCKRAAGSMDLCRSRNGAECYATEFLINELKAAGGE